MRGSLAGFYTILNEHPGVYAQFPATSLWGTPTDARRGVHNLILILPISLITDLDNSGG